MKSIILIVLGYFLTGFVLNAAEKAELPPIEEALKQVPKEILELLEKMPEKENEKLPALPDDVKQALKSIDIDSPDWDAYLALLRFKSGSEVNPAMYRWIAVSENSKLMSGDEFIKRYNINEIMRGLSAVHTDECPKIPVAKSEYAPLLDACLISGCERLNHWGMSPHVGGLSGLALVFRYKNVPRFILGIGYPLRHKLGGGIGPFYHSIHLYDLKQDLSIKKVVWVDQYEMLGEIADKAAIEFWEMLEVGAWVTPSSDMNQRLEKIEDIEKGAFAGPIFVPKIVAPDAFAVEDFCAATHRWGYNGHMKRMAEHNENIKALEEQIEAAADPAKKEILLAEKEKEIAELNKEEEKLSKLKKSIEIIEEYIKRQKTR